MVAGDNNFGILKKILDVKGHLQITFAGDTLPDLHSAYALSVLCVCVLC